MKRQILVALTTSAAIALAVGVMAQNTFPTPAAGVKAGGNVMLVCDVNGQNCSPVSANNPLAVTGASGPVATAANQTNGAAKTQIVDSGGNGYAAGIAAASGLLSPGQFVFPTRSYPLLSDGTNFTAARGDTTGQFTVGQPVATASAGIAPVATSAVSPGVVLKASGGNLYGLNVVTGATGGYVLVFNSTTVPADGAVTPAKCLSIAANTSIDLPYRAAPIYLGTGIAVVFSTTGCFTKTGSPTAFISGDVK